MPLISLYLFNDVLLALIKLLLQVAQFLFFISAPPYTFYHCSRCIYYTYMPFGYIFLILIIATTLITIKAYILCNYYLFYTFFDRVSNYMIYKGAGVKLYRAGSIPHILVISLVYLLYILYSY